jgi:hypothetical protein
MQNPADRRSPAVVAGDRDLLEFLEIVFPACDVEGVAMWAERRLYLASDFERDVSESRSGVCIAILCYFSGASLLDIAAHHSTRCHTVTLERPIKGFALG